VVGSALALTALLVLLASAAFLLALLPLALLATLNPTLTFEGVPSTQYPTSYLGVQAPWTVLVGIGAVAAGRAISLPPMATEDTSLPADYPPAPANERLAGLLEAVTAEY
jgi:uncharacterized protein (DUF58 family)